jgi:hypothetical protein
MNAARAIRIVHTEAGAVLQNTDNGASFSTNPVGARIWVHLVRGLTEHEIVDRLSIEFCVARDRVCRDVEEFLKGLERTGLLKNDASKAQ